MELTLHNLADVLLCISGLGLGNHLFQSWDQHLPHLSVEHVCLLLQNWGQSLLDLLFDELGKCSADRFGNRRLHLQLDVFLACDLLVELVQFCVQVCVLLVQLLVVVYQKLLLAFAVGWDRLLGNLLGRFWGLGFHVGGLSYLNF